MLWLYLSLALVGTVLPFSQFLPWFAEHGLNVPLLITELFSTRMGGFFGLDVLVSAVVLIAFIRSEGARRKMGMLWLPTAATSTAFDIVLTFEVAEIELLFSESGLGTAVD